MALNMRKSIIFFMLVTPHDALIAQYSIKSFCKLTAILHAFDWKLQVYMNCLAENQKQDLERLSSKFQYVELIDNEEFFEGESIVPGQNLNFEGGGKRPFEGKYEIGCVVWEREFRKFASDYWCIVDADFEIIEPGFVQYAFKELESNGNVYLFSTDRGQKRRSLNTYTGEKIWSMPRYDTWFCVYKSECRVCETPLFYHEEIHNNEKYVWDDTGWFQENLQKQTGCDFNSIDLIFPIEKRKDYKYQYIHYGAFSKNVSLKSKRDVAIFRKIMILSHRGIACFRRDSLMNKIVRRYFGKIRRSRYNHLIEERQTYHYE